MAKILTVDDDEDVLFQLRFALSRFGHEVFPLARADRLIEQFQKVQPDIVISDIVMPGIMGGGVYGMIRQKLGPHVPVIVSSGTRLKIREGENDPLLAYCPKPVDFEELENTIKMLLERKEALIAGNASEDDIDDVHE